jgi:hypothetical protein
MLPSPSIRFCSIDGRKNSFLPVKLQDDITLAPAPARASDLRRHNLAMIMRQVAGNEDVSRAELVSLTGLTKGTVSVLVQELLDSGLVVERGRQAVGQVGRPRRALALNGDAHCGIGVDIGVDYLSVCVVDLLNRARYERIESSENRDLPPSVVLDRSARLVMTAIEAACGDGLALLVAPNLGWSGVRIVHELTARLAGPAIALRVDNEANLAALAELWLGDGADCGDYIYVSAEIGMGRVASPVSSATSSSTQPGRSARAAAGDASSASPARRRSSPPPAWPAASSRASATATAPSPASSAPSSTATSEPSPRCAAPARRSAWRSPGSSTSST